MTLPIALPQDLPAGCTARLPVADDIEELTALVAAHQRFARGWATVDIEGVTANVTGIGSWTRRQVVVEAEDGAICAWAWVHDRAAGRTMPDVTVAPDFDRADEVAALAAALGPRERCRVSPHNVSSTAPSSTARRTPPTSGSAAGSPRPASSTPAPGCR